MNKFFKGLSWSVIALVLAPAYGVDAQTLEKVRIGISDVSFTFLPHLIAKDTGIFQKHGLQVEVIFIGGPVGTAALAAGELDYSASTDSGIPAAVQGVPIKAVLFAMKAPPFYLISQPGLKKINELVGKKVGLSRLGTSPYFASRRIFKKFNVDVEKITYIQAGSNTNRVIALTNGSLDASMLSLPTARIMIDKGFTELASPRDIGLIPHAGLIARTAIIDTTWRRLRQSLQHSRAKLQGDSADQTRRAPHSGPAHEPLHHGIGGIQRLVPLSTFASLKNTAEPRELKKFQQLNAVRIQGVIPPPVPLDQALRFLEDEARAILPQGFTIDYAGESRQLRTEGNTFLATFLLSAILIYLVLAAQFESFRDPFIILAGSVPLALSGALLFSFLNLTTLNIYSQVGLITLVGLVSKNGILIVQFANHLQELGTDKLAAIIEASGTRLRPILMTTAATVMGHFPLIIATGPGAGARNSIGIMLVSGMIIGSIFTLFVVPSIYMLVAKKHVLIPSAVPEQEKDDLQTPPLRPAPRLTGVHEGASV